MPKTSLEELLQQSDFDAQHQEQVEDLGQSGLAEGFAHMGSDVGLAEEVGVDRYQDRGRDYDGDPQEMDFDDDAFSR